MSDEQSTPPPPSIPLPNVTLSNLDRLPPPAKLASPRKDANLLNPYFAKNYMNDDVPKFKHTSEASLTTYSSLFGISAVEVRSLFFI